jgi:hypothetical protein
MRPALAAEDTQPVTGRALAWAQSALGLAKDRTDEIQTG